MVSGKTHPQLAHIFSLNNRYETEQKKIQGLLANAFKEPAKFDFEKARSIRDTHFTNTARESLKRLQSTRSEVNSNLWKAVYENMVHLVKKSLAENRELSYEEHIVVFMLYSLLQNHNTKTYAHYGIAANSWVTHDLAGLEALPGLTFLTLMSHKMSEYALRYFQMAHLILRKRGALIVYFDGLGIDDIALTIGEPLHVMNATPYSIQIHGTPHRSSEVARHDLEHAEHVSYEHEFAVKFKQWLTNFKPQQTVQHEEALKTIILFAVGRDLLTGLFKRATESHFATPSNRSSLSEAVYDMSREYLDGQNTRKLSGTDLIWSAQDIRTYIDELSVAYAKVFPAPPKTRNNWDDDSSLRY